MTPKRDRTAEDIVEDNEIQHEKASTKALEARVAALEAKIASLEPDLKKIESLHFLTNYAAQINRFFGHGAV